MRKDGIDNSISGGVPAHPTALSRTFFSHGNKLYCTKGKESKVRLKLVRQAENYQQMTRSLRLIFGGNPAKDKPRAATVFGGMLVGVLWRPRIVPYVANRGCMGAFSSPERSPTGRARCPTK